MKQDFAEEGQHIVDEDLGGCFWVSELPDVYLFVSGRLKASCLPWFLSTVQYLPEIISPFNISTCLLLAHFSATHKSMREKGALFSRAFIIRGQWYREKKKTLLSKFYSENQT